MKKPSSGFTFIELVLYAAVVSIVVITLIPVGWNVVQGSVRASVEREVYDNARSISERLKYEIRSATAITAVDSTSITLTTAVPANNPTVIDFSGGNIRLQQGAGSPINLNSGNTSVLSLIFTDLRNDPVNTSQSIAFSFSLGSNYQSTGGEIYNAVITIQSSAELRSH